MKIFLKYGIAFILLSSTQSLLAQTTITLKGKVLGRDSKTIFIVPSTTSLRTEDKPTISIVDHKFEYTFTAKEVEAYQLVFEDEYEKGPGVR